jgi:hypothetical protein
VTAGAAGHHHTPAGTTITAAIDQRPTPATATTDTTGAIPRTTGTAGTTITDRGQQPRIPARTTSTADTPGIDRRTTNTTNTTDTDQREQTRPATSTTAATHTTHTGGPTTGTTGATTDGMRPTISADREQPAPATSTTDTTNTTSRRGDRTRTANTTQLRWQALSSNTLVRVERATNLNGPWTSVVTKLTTGEFTDINTPAGSAFYRIVTEP